MPDLDRMVGGLRCRDVLDLLPDYVDGELDADTLGRVNEHLRGCDTCEKFGGEYGALVAHLRDRLTAAEPEAGVADRLADHMRRFWKGEPDQPPPPSGGS